jgi:hypothetical protein
MDIDVGGHECTLYERQILICYDLPVYRRTKKRIYFIVCTQICFTHCSRSSGPMYIYGIYNDDRYASTSKASAGLLGVTCQWKGQCGAPSILGYLRGCLCLGRMGLEPTLNILLCRSTFLTRLIRQSLTMVCVQQKPQIPVSIAS